VCVNGKTVAESFVTTVPLECVTEERDGSGGNWNDILGAEQTEISKTLCFT
jgi:hypothetical protein